MKVFGLTGGIASGKSQAAKYFQAEGIPVIDADLIAREISQKNGAGHDAIMKRFGTAERSELRKIIYADPAARQDLEKILHPMIQAESRKQIQALAPTSTIVLYEAALLIETGRYREFESLIVVEASRELRRERLISRDGIPAHLAEQMISVQATDEDRKKLATYLLDNSSSLENLHLEVQKLSAKLRALP